MNIILSLVFLGFMTIPIWIKSTYMILPKYNLNNDFGIVASVSEANSIEDIIGRPLHTNVVNQYYFSDSDNYINLMQPNIGISFSYDYKGNEFSIIDKIKLRLPKVFDCGIFTIINIDKLLNNNFYFPEENDTKLKYFKNKMYFFYNNAINFEVNYYDKNILYSLSLFESNNFKFKKANINHGYFITLTKIYDLFESKLQHYITRWNCNNYINIYIDKSIPVEWIPTFKIGLTKWNQALYSADSRCNINVISYLDKEWRSFKNGDIKYSSISLAPSSMDRTYAVGHFDFNWKTGEIYRGNIMVSGNWIDYWNKQFDFLVKLLEVNKAKNICNNTNITTFDKENINSYKDKFIKKGMQSIVVHEMGHILGLRHNFKASSLVKYDDLLDYQRIKTEGLIPSIMDYFNMVINTKYIYDCVTMECIYNNVEIMDDIGKYDFQTILYGYGNKTNIDYDLGPDEFLDSDALSNMGDVSDLPGKYNSDFLFLSKYIIDKYKFKKNVSEFNTYWKIQSTYVTSHYKYLEHAININMKILSKFSYNLSGNIINIKKTQIESINFLKNVLNSMFYLEEKIYFTYPECEISKNYYCHGMEPYDLIDTHSQINQQISTYLNSYEFQELIENNYILTKKKTISPNLFLKLINKID
jgi:hypothetical protein